MVLLMGGSRKMVLLMVLLMGGSLLAAGQELGMSLSEPIVSKPGDFILAGIFDIGNLETLTEGDRNRSSTVCKIVASDVYSIEKALIFQDSVNNMTLGNKTVGYEIYTGCSSKFLTQHVSSKVALDPRVVAVLGADKQDLTQPSVAAPTAYFIPTFTYMYSDQELLDQGHYPTLISLIGTEEMEGSSVVKLLSYMGQQYVDVWYHKYSEGAADHVKTEYLDKDGNCGRITLYSASGDLESSFREYFSYQVPAAPVQVLLFNAKTATLAFLNHTIMNLGWRNKTYIFGFSVARNLFHNFYKDILDGAEGTDRETFIYLQSELLNLNMSRLRDPGQLMYRKAHAPSDRLSEMYATSRQCSDLVCRNTRSMTSWLGFVMTAVKLVEHNLKAMLTQEDRSATSLRSVYTLRQDLFRNIVQQEATNLTFYNQTVTGIGFINSTISLGFQVEVYKRTYEHPRTAGRVSFNSGTSNLSLDLSSQRTCSEPCEPGYHQIVWQFSVPCCWECRVVPSCGANQIARQTLTPATSPYKRGTRRKSRQTIPGECEQCPEEEYSIDQTTCYPVVREFISRDSIEFKGGVALVILATIGTVSIGVFLYLQRLRPIVKASDPVFCYLFLISLVLGDLTTFVTLLKPSETVCTIEYYGCIGFVTCVTACLFFRSLKIYRVFQAAKKFQIVRPFIFKFLGRRGQFGSVLVALMADAALGVVSLRHGGWRYTELQLEKHQPLYLMCSPQNFLATWYPFVVPIMLFLLTLYLAYKMRLFPHNFKETTSIFSTSIMVLVTCAMFLSGYSLASPSLQPLLRAIVYFSIAQAFLACLFVPKLLVLFKREDLAREQGDNESDLHSFARLGTASTPARGRTPVPTIEISGPEYLE